MITFSSLGIEWTVSGQNDPESARAVLRVAAAIQVVTADLADVDLALIPIQSHVDVGLTGTIGAAPHQNSSNEGRRWTVLLAPWTPESEASELTTEVLTAVVNVLSDVSLLPMERFMERIEPLMARGLLNKISFGAVFDQVLAWLHHSKFDLAQLDVALPDQVFAVECRPAENLSLPWLGGPGPTYDQQTSEAAISRRYSEITRLIPSTLSRLASDAAFQATLTELRSRNCVDWQILTALFNITVNWLAEAQGVPIGPAGESALQQLASAPEATGEPPPTEIFELELIERYLVPVLVMSLQIFGLECRQDLPDIAAIERFLTVRYRYLVDDVDHPDPFS